MKPMSICLFALLLSPFAQADMGSVCKKKSDSILADWAKKRVEQSLTLPLVGGGLVDLSPPVRDNKKAIRTYEKCINIEAEKQAEKIEEVSCELLKRSYEPNKSDSIEICTSIDRQKEEIYEKAEEFFEAYREGKESKKESISRDQATHRVVIPSRLYVECEGALIEDDSFTEKSELVIIAGAYDRCDVITDLEYEQKKKTK